MDDIIRFVADLIEKGYAYESQGMFISVRKKSHNYAKLANKTLEDLELGASGRQMKKQLARKIQSTLPSGSCQNQVRFLGTVLGDLVVRAGTLSVRSCQRGF